MSTATPPPPRPIRRHPRLGRRAPARSGGALPRPLQRPPPPLGRRNPARSRAACLLRRHRPPLGRRPPAPSGFSLVCSEKAAPRSHWRRRPPAGPPHPRPRPRRPRPARALRHRYPLLSLPSLCLSVPTSPQLTSGQVARPVIGHVGAFAVEGARSAGRARASGLPATNCLRGAGGASEQSPCASRPGGCWQPRQEPA
jgi:hypothetical protein